MRTLLLAAATASLAGLSVAVAAPAQRVRIW